MANKIMDKLNNTFIGRLFKRRQIQQFFVALIFLISITAILANHLIPEKFDLNLGETATINIYSPKDIENKWETERLRSEAAESVDLIYKVDLGVHLEVKREIESYLSYIYSVKDNSELENDEKINALINNNTYDLTEETFQAILNTSNEKLKYLETYIYEIVAQNMNTGLKVEDLQRQKNDIREFVLNISDFSVPKREFAISLINTAIRPNQFLDLELTQQKKQEAMESIPKVMVKKGDLIIEQGEVITLDKYKLLGELSILEEENKIDFMLYLGILLIGIAFELLIIAYIYVFNKDLLLKTDKLLMISIIFITTLIISEAIANISIYLIPVGASAMLLSILIEPRLGLLINICLTILISILTGNDIIFIVMAIVGGTVGVFSVLHTHQRSSLLLSGLVVGIVNVAIIIGIWFIYSNEFAKVISLTIYGFINGVLCAILTIGTLPLWENLFGIVTPLKLLELANPNHPLLKKLLLETPGTYHHSIIVGNLSESATDAVGGNPLLARVGAFYHDIGKTKRPYFFKENQLTSENPHDKINPSLSSLIITGHIRDGVELAKKHKLPVEIIDFIEQHHGNTLVAYFYHKAKNDDSIDCVDEHTFRYHGPKPRTKETAIVMLADSAEAAVRSISSPTKEKIEKLVSKIIQEKLEDGQLDECDLTLKELELIKQTFIKIILGIFHERIEYPDLDVKDLKGRKASETSN
ncbi:HD family phosphohydrolase [Serpentinicella alkaliphila]|uniref:HD/PDEase domain-containing protein n=1 Tax=Serpentinicella alkaliphila TaxID=1734049 RepID=A0A4R2U2U1_9FIRM|nr:HDIG domain-containing metalloprotein [Serpentinicella alkaliphila]QUH26902.1 HDIG domain-containing protein [Serpentinicella alkaliphila]TCQ08135.1 hypothetical protein EDD79_1001224 [Serpentinicella alkaliphila]